MRRSTLGIAAAAASITTLLLTGCSATGGSAQAGAGGGGSGGGGSSAPVNLRIMVGGLSKQIYLPNYLANKLGYFTAEGLNVTLLDETSGRAAEQQVLAGQVEAGSGSYNKAIELQSQGKSMETVVLLGLAPGEAEMVATKKAGVIKSAADLKGRNLGVTEIGSGTQTLTTAAVGRAGLSTKDVQFVPVGAGSTFIAAMQQGKIDAGMTTEPTITQLLTSGTGKVLLDLRTPTTTRSVLGGDYPFISVFMNTSYVNKNKAVVQKLTNAYVKTLKWIASHSAEQIAAKVPADFYAGNKQGYIKALAAEKAMFSPDGRMPAEGAKTVLNIENKYVPAMIGKGSGIDLGKTYTNEFVDNAK